MIACRSSLRAAASLGASIPSTPSGQRPLPQLARIALHRSFNSNEEAPKQFTLAESRKLLHLPVDEPATEKAVKAAYRQLSMQLHPDRNPDSDGAEFKEVKKAYDLARANAIHHDVKVQKAAAQDAFKSSIRRRRKGKR